MPKKGEAGRTQEHPSYSREKLKKFEEILQQSRQRIMQGFDEQKAEIDGFKGETESDANDDASNIVELNILMTLSDSQKRELDQITMAMMKIKDGTYGICEGCGQLISEKRLLALPFANLCVECKGKEERGTVVLQRENRIAPVDEDFLVSDDENEPY